jgi:DNA-binding PucR family transcriptional regulator
MPIALSQAILAIKIGKKISGTVNKCADYAYAYLLSRLAEDNGLAAGLLHPALTALKKYDEKHRTSLYGTLYEYLRLDRNVVATAKHLFIHRNSMIYRLQRLENLLNLNLNDINVRMYLMLSYHIDMIKDVDFLDKLAV